MVLGSDTVLTAHDRPSGRPGFFRLDRSGRIHYTEDMENNESTERTCCYCGQRESFMIFKATCPDGDLICAGICQTGLLVDSMEE